MSKVIRNINEPSTWRHDILLFIWILIILPAGFLIVAATVAVWLEEMLDNLWRKLHRWANPETTVRRREAFMYDYLHADNDSVTQPYPPDKTDG